MLKSQDTYLELYTKNKLKSLFLADVYNSLGYDKKYMSVKECGTFLEFCMCVETGEVALTGANFCRDRLCPMCAKRKSLKEFSNLSKVLDILNKNNQYRYLFCTLTLKNCEYDELSKTLDTIKSGFTNFIKSHFFRGKNKQFLGCFKSIEITINTTTREFHPHIHLLIAVDKYYFSKYNLFYIDNQKLKEEWQVCLGIDYLPMCDIRSVNNIKKATCEVSKYICKSSDYLFYDDITKSSELVSILSDSLYNRRFVAYIGIFNKAKKLIKNNDNINIDDIDKNKELNYIFSRYQWNIGFSRYEQF